MLPQLRESAWHQDAHRGERHFAAAPSVRPEYSAPVEKELRRARKRQTVRLERAQRAIGGAFIRNRRNGAVAA